MSKTTSKVNNEKKFPHCLVWTPIPIISYLLPCIGHLGVTSYDGIIHDFAGPYTINKDNFLFGKPTRFVPLDPTAVLANGESAEPAGRRWNSCLAKATSYYEGEMYNIMTNNCHVYVATFLNTLNLYDGGWNSINLAARVFLTGRFVSISAFIQTFLPFTIIVVLCGYFGRLIFLYCYLGICVPLLAWFVSYTFLVRAQPRVEEASNSTAQ
mmetsp:Transcript_33224/g.60053  ORF Transcript_33224/g.60053 Transcript_33224/m.60053 type:complete len:211 (+) Transcript_33224:217-849(+)